jgi:hypothetical protein
MGNGERIHMRTCILVAPVSLYICMYVYMYVYVCVKAYIHIHMCMCVYPFPLQIQAAFCFATTKVLASVSYMMQRVGHQQYFSHVWPMHVCLSSLFMKVYVCIFIWLYICVCVCVWMRCACACFQFLHTSRYPLYKSRKCLQVL